MLIVGKIIEMIESKELEGVDVREVEKMVKEVEKGNVSKSKGMKELYLLGYDRGEIRDILNSGGKLNVSYNFVNNVLSEEFGDLRKSRKNNSGVSKSGEIRRLFNEGYSEREIGEEFVKKGVYVNSNMIYSVVKKEKKKLGK